MVVKKIIMPALLFDNIFNRFKLLGLRFHRIVMVQRIIIIIIIIIIKVFAETSYRHQRKGSIWKFPRTPKNCGL